jgi:hypothetical protein
MELLPTHVLFALNKRILNEYKFLKSVVFDPESTYENSIMTDRMNGRLPVIHLDENRANQLPMLSWNRGSFQLVNRPNSLFEMNDNSSVQINFAVTQFEYNFTLFTTNIEELERFELEWFTKKGLRNIAIIKVSADELGEFDYKINWQPELTSLSFSIENNYYKSISGSGTISGTFLYSQDMTQQQLNSQIREIKVQLVDCTGNDLTDESFYTIRK